MARYAEEAPRGEFVLVMAGAAPEETEETWRRLWPPPGP